MSAELYTYKTFSGNAVTDTDQKKGIVTGYFSAFGNKDSDGDIIMPGAFLKTIAEAGPNSAQPRIKHLQNHNPYQPLGKLMTLQEDAKGLYYESQVGSHALGLDFIKMVESGLISEHSIGFKTIREEQKSTGNHMLELKLWEGSSLTAWGANHLTPLTGMKGSAELEDMLSRQKAIERFCAKTDATDETIQMLLLHSKQLTQIILDLQKSATAPVLITTLPANEVKSAIKDTIKSLLNSN